MTRDELLIALKKIAFAYDTKDSDDKWWDEERSHIEADELLLQFINDPEITEAFDSIRKWYS